MDSKKSEESREAWTYLNRHSVDSALVAHDFRIAV